MLRAETSRALARIRFRPWARPQSSGVDGLRYFDDEVGFRSLAAAAGGDDQVGDIQLVVLLFGNTSRASFRASSVAAA